MFVFIWFSINRNPKKQRKQSRPCTVVVISEVDHPVNSHRKLNVEEGYLLCLNTDIRWLAPSATSYDQSGWWAQTLAENLWKPLKVTIAAGLKVYSNYIFSFGSISRGRRCCRSMCSTVCQQITCGSCCLGQIWLWLFNKQLWFLSFIFFPFCPLIDSMPKHSLKCLLFVFQLAYKPAGYKEWQNCWWGKDPSLFFNAVVWYTYMYSFMLCVCYCIVSVCLKLPCLLALRCFLFVKFPLLRKLEVATTVVVTVSLTTSDSPELTLCQQCGILC